MNINLIDSQAPRATRHRRIVKFMCCAMSLMLLSSLCVVMKQQVFERLTFFLPMFAFSYGMICMYLISKID